MSQIDRLLDKAWAETGTVSSGAVEPTGDAFTISVMGAVARRRFVADLARRFALAAALFAVALILAPAAAEIHDLVGALLSAGALTTVALMVVAAVSLGAALRRWPAVIARM